MSHVKIIKNSPKHKSEKFLMRMLMVFLALTEPASRKANPACMKMIRVPICIRKRWSMFSAMALIYYGVPSIYYLDQNIKTRTKYC